MISLFPEVLATYIEIFLVFSYYDLFLIKKYEGRKHILLKQIIIALLTVFVTAVNIWNIDPYITVTGFTLGYSLFASTIYKCKLIEAKCYSPFHITVIYNFTLFAFDLIFGALSGLINEQTAWSIFMIDLYWGRVGYLVILKAVNIATYFLFKHAFLKKAHIKPNYMVYMSIACMVIFVSSIFTDKTLLPDERIASKVNVLISGTIYLIFLATMFLLANKFSLMSIKQENDKIIKIEYRLMKENYLSLTESMQSHNKIIHEIKNHLLVMLNYAKHRKTDELVQMIEELIHTSSSIHLDFSTGSEIVDLVIQNKISIAHSHGLNIEFETQDLKSMQIDPIDMCSILSNLLDNAIDACSILESSTKPTIHVKIRRLNDFLSIKVINPVCMSPLKNVHEHITSKKEGEIHGFGLRVVEECVEHYHGDIRFDYDNFFFSVSILLCL